MEHDRGRIFEALGKEHILFELEIPGKFRNDVSIKVRATLSNSARVQLVCSEISVVFLDTPMGPQPCIVKYNLK